VQSARATPGRLLLLIHGWTGDEDSMWVFARNLSPNYAVLAPRAPHVTKPRGYSWRLPPPDHDGGPDIEALRSSAEALITLVDEYSKDQRLQAGTIDVMGFSQGAALAGTLTLLFPGRIGKAALLAGFIPEGAETLVSARPLEGKRIFMARGSLDDTVNIEFARRAAELLEAAAPK
jgi:phospholipase/carboxylesterase